MIPVTAMKCTKLLTAGVLLLMAASAFAVDTKFQTWIANNRVPASKMPLSYQVPADYFDDIPPAERPHVHLDYQYVGHPCNRTVSPDELNNYTFQTEKWLSTNGVNIYDAAVWAIASSVLGSTNDADFYHLSVLVSHRTLQLIDIKADAACKGIMSDGACNGTDCGFCYGDAAAKDPSQGTEDTKAAYFFRMISDFYGAPEAIALCPEKGIPWAWNDWRPVLGEQAWAQMIGPLQTAFIRNGGDLTKISDDDNAFKLGLSLLPTLEKMLIPSVGAVYYAPHNTYDLYNKAVGCTVSTENQVSLLSGLRAMRATILGKPSSSHQDVIPRIEALIANVTMYLKSAYSPDLGYFRQGGFYNHTNATWLWTTGTQQFAMDCQSWTMSVLGEGQVDAWFGQGTAKKIWEYALSVGGYCKNGGCTGIRYQGVGFANNTAVQILSGEWTMGAINMMKVWANETTDDSWRSELLDAVDDMRSALDNELTVSVSMDAPGPWTHGAGNATAMLYANQRYNIPFGWWANPVPSMASTGWAVLVDNHYNPFHLGGDYASSY